MVSQAEIMIVSVVASMFTAHAQYCTIHARFMWAQRVCVDSGYGAGTRGDTCLVTLASSGVV